MSLRSFPPVEPVERPARLAQTFLSHFDSCNRSGYLYLKHEGGPSSHALERGSAFHAFAERATNLLLGRGETRMPHEVAKDLMQDVIAEGGTVPASEQDALRVMAFHWAQGTVLRPDEIVGVERTFTLDLGGATLSGKLDLAWIHGNQGGVRDYKTSFAMGSQEEVAQSFQIPFYGVLLAFGTAEGEALGSRLDTFHLELVYPRYLHEEGMATRSVVVTRQELEDHRRYLEGLVAKVQRAFESWDFPAVPGSHCSICPALAECPIRAELRGIGLIEDREDAASAAERWFFKDAEVKQLTKDLRAFAKTHGPIRFGKDLVLDFKQVNAKTLDRDGLEVAIHMGEPFALDDFYRDRSSSKFGKRTLGADELQAERDWGVAV